MRIINNYSKRARWISKDRYHLISSKPEQNDCFIENLTTILKKKSRKNGRKEKRNLNGTRIDHMTERKRRQNLAKCWSVSSQS